MSTNVGRIATILEGVDSGDIITEAGGLSSDKKRMLAESSKLSIQNTNLLQKRKHYRCLWVRLACTDTPDDGGSCH